jgi:hypothetical protein
MVSPSASLPIVIIFEQHFDKAPKQVINSLIPTLASEGYDTFCFEAPEYQSEEEIVWSHNYYLDDDSPIASGAENRTGLTIAQLCDLEYAKLVELIQKNGVPAPWSLRSAEKIRSLPARLLTKTMYNLFQEYSISIKGIDINEILSVSKDIFGGSSEEVKRKLKEIEGERINAFSDNLIKLNKNENGNIFLCGVGHAENLMNKFKEKGIDDRILYYFPYTVKDLFETRMLPNLLSNETLKDHKFCLMNESDIKSLTGRIVKEIKEKNVQYKEEIIGANSHSFFLSDFFKEKFRAFLRLGHYVDALLDIEKSGDAKAITAKLKEFNIPTSRLSLLGSTFVVIRDVNTKEVAENIRRLK